MNNFFIGLFSLSLIFGITFLIVFGIKYLTFAIKNKNSKSKTAPEPKIYYVQKTVTENKKRKRSPKKASIALKGIVVTKEELEREKEKI